ncbi:hypothetical protein [Nocardioides sp. KR10-350]|uniref:hypothetical protein n=1 Tax=Nocardioides cheoyonin TaxID=3156615 RepID=UPI0032B46E98
MELLVGLPDARPRQVWDRLRLCTHPRLYAAQLDAEELAAYGRTLDVDTAIAHYLAHGARAGKRISVVFNPGWYADRLTERGIELPDGAAPFLHWLSVGWDERIVPTPLFDEDWYRAKHPLIGHQWAFVQYLNRGLYEPYWRPSPLGKHHSGGPVPDAADQHAPLLLPEMLHRAEDHDLTRTSWLEEGCLRSLDMRAALRSARMQDLIAKAAAIEPLVDDGRPDDVPMTCPPYRAPRLYMAAQAEAVRSRVAATHVDTVIVVADLDAGTLAGPAGLLAAGLREAERSSSVLLVAAPATTATVPAETALPAALPEGVEALDLAPYAQGFDEDRRVDLLLDLVRGLRVDRVVAADSTIGWRLFAGYARQLAEFASLGACLSPAARTEHGNLAGFAVREFQESFADLDWVLVTTPELAEDLTARYVLPAASRQRLLTAYAPGEPRRLDPAAVKHIVADRERRQPDEGAQR